VASHCINCGTGCALDLKVSGQRLVWIKDGKQEAPNYSSTCQRGRFRVYDDLWYGQRISQPMIKQDGSFQEVSWDQAVDAVVNGFKAVSEGAGAGAIAALGSPQASNESLYLLQKWLRVGFLSHGLDFPGRDAHERLLEKMEETIGFAGMTQELSGLDRAEAIFLVGDNLEAVSPVMATFVRRAARQRQVPVFQIASKADGLTPLATDPVKANSSVWNQALQGILAAAASSGAVAGDMLSKAGLKAEQLKTKLGAADLKAAASKSGIPAETLSKMAAALAKTGKAAFVFAENLLEADATADCVTTLIQLAALTGNLGGTNAGGLYPLACDINTYGAHFMGISPNYLPGLVKLTSATARKNIAKIWHATKMPATPATALLAALDAQQIKALFVQQPSRLDDSYLQRLGQVDFLVVQDTVPSSAMDMAQVVLPMAAFGEQQGTVVNVERRLLSLQQAFAPCGGALADWEAIARIMAAQGLPAPKDLDELHQEWSEVVVGLTGFPFNGKLAAGIQLPYDKDSGNGTCCFDASAIKKLKLGL
jgi:predicted molibdopterin-dependent oxidoreductase YjgC